MTKSCGDTGVTEEGNSNVRREAKAKDVVNRLMLGPCDSRLGPYLHEFFCRLPDDAFDCFERHGHAIRVIQPTMNTFVACRLPEGGSVPEVTLILFVSNLCDHDRNDVLYTIAHEFAHVYLGHRSLYCMAHRRIIETDADALVIRWGFEAELRGSQWSYIYGMNNGGAS